MDEKTEDATLTARAVAAGVVCAAIVCVLVTYAELVIVTVRIGYLQLPPVTVAMLALALAVNAGLKRLLGGRWGFSRVEMVVVYVMSLVAAMVSAHGLVQKWLPLLVAPLYFAANNNWQSFYADHLPRWLVPYDPHGPPKQPVASWYYEGLPHGVHSIPWQPWVRPLLVWGVFLACILFAFLCLAAILRRQWVDNEKISFPLAQLPLEMIGGASEDGKSFFANPLTWIGAAIPVIVFGIDWAHQLFPSIPLIPTSLSLNTFLTTPPWNGIGGMPLIFSFAAVGFFFLLPSDILLSIWFFFLLTRVEQVIVVMANMDQPGMPLYPPPLFIGYQTAGAYLMLVGYLFVTARPHLARVFRTAIGREKPPESEGELLSYPVAFWGLFGSLLAACVMLTIMGMSFWLAVMELFVLVFVIALVMARSTAEAGMIMTETTFRPIDLYRIMGNIHDLGPANLTMLAFVDNLLMRDQRGLLLTGMLDSARLGDGLRVNRRSIAWSIGIGIVAAVVVAVPLQLWLAYTVPGNQMDGWMMQSSPQMTFNDYRPYFTGTPAALSSAWQIPAFFVVGLSVTVFLARMRMLFFWWPLNPLGYALSGSWTTIQFWFPCFVAWVLKSVTIHYGGNGAYHKARPLFLGMVIGEFGMAVVSTVVYMAFKVPPPPFPWS